MLVSLSTGSLYLYPLRWTFSLAKRAGFDGVELVIGPEVEWRGPAYVNRLIREFQLPVLTVHPPLYGYRGWDMINESYAPYLDKAIALSDSVGARLMVVHSPRAYDAQSGVGLDFVEKVAEARSSMNGHGPRLGIENGAKFSRRDRRYILQTLPELRDFADRHDLKMTLDTAHLGTFDLDLLDSLEFFDGRVGNIHLSDLRSVPHWLMHQPRLHSYYRQHQFPGTGTLPLRALLRELSSRGYTGPVTYELSPLAIRALTPWRVECKLREAVAFVREAVDSVRSVSR
jgi:sugar phosphate isomerase/epimerase